MKIVFVVPGKYRSDTRVVVVSEKQVEDKTVFNIYTENALNFIRAKKAYEEGTKIPAKEPAPDDFEDPAPDKDPEPDDIEIDLDEMKLPELLEFAIGKEIDLGDNKLKADVLEAIKAFEASKK